MRNAILWGALFWFSATGVAADPPWYDSELVHNAVHDLEEVGEKWKGRLDKRDPAEVRTRLDAFLKAVDHVHDELHADPERDATAILRAFRRVGAPLKRLVVAVRANQIRLKKPTPHLYDAWEVIDLYSRLKFWMTPVP